MNGARRLRFCAPQRDRIGSIDPHALKIPARRAEHSLAESALPPFHAEPATRLKVFKQYKDLDLEAFSGLVRSFVGYDENAWSEVRPEEERGDGESSFAKRLTTGLAAEQYFESVQPRLPEFNDCVLENTTRLGSGYDFRLRSEARRDFLAVEVKGLKERTGTLAFTPKEHEVAAALNSRFFFSLSRTSHTGRRMPNMQPVRRRQKPCVFPPRALAHARR